VIIMFDKIKNDISQRMSQYNDSRQPTGDEISIAWLVAEFEQLRRSAITLADEADIYQEGEGDRMNLDDAISKVYSITGI